MTQLSLNCAYYIIVNIKCQSSLTVAFSSLGGHFFGWRFFSSSGTLLSLEIFLLFGDTSSAGDFSSLRGHFLGWRFFFSWRSVPRLEIFLLLGDTSSAGDFSSLGEVSPKWRFFYKGTKKRASPARFLEVILQRNEWPPPNNSQLLLDIAGYNAFGPHRPLAEVRKTPASSWRHTELDTQQRHSLGRYELGTRTFESFR